MSEEFSCFNFLLVRNYNYIDLFSFKAKFEKACDKIRADKIQFHDFINRMDSWLVKNHKNIARYFRRFDEDGEGILTYEDFKSGKVLLSHHKDKLSVFMLPHKMCADCP